MKKIIIIGQNADSCTHIEGVLNEYGMASANPSRREKLTPIEISQVLKKAMDADSLALQDHSKKMIKVSNTVRNGKKQYSIVDSTSNDCSLWDHIPMDLMLANMDQELWGWSDPQAIDVADYWHQFDEDILFLFVYDRPQQLLINENNELPKDLSSESISQHFNEWGNYNKKVLDFIKRNPKRSLLVNAQEFKALSEHSVESIFSRIGYSNNITDIELADPQNHFYDLQRKPQVSPLTQLIIDSLMHRNPLVREQYEALQHYAKLPYSELSNTENGTLYQTELAALQEIRETEAQLEANEQIQKILVDENQQISESKAKLEQKTISLMETNSQLADNNNLLNQENQQKSKVIGKLQQKQKEIEQAHKTLKADNNTLQQQKSQTEQIKTLLEQDMFGILDEFTYLSDENNELLLELQLMQEKYETLFKQSLELKNQTPPLYGAEEQVKNHLSYRFGRTLVQTSFFNFFCLPFSLLREYVEHKVYLKQHPKQPALTQYADAYKGEKIKRFLSYKLGATFINTFNKPYTFKWLLLPYFLYKTNKHHKKGEH